jgi:hypothetical protein
MEHINTLCGQNAEIFIVLTQMTLRVTTAFYRIVRTLEGYVTMGDSLHQYYTGHWPLSRVYLIYITFRRSDPFPSSGVRKTLHKADRSQFTGPIFRVCMCMYVCIHMLPKPSVLRMMFN